MIIIRKRTMSPKQTADLENAVAQAEATKAMLDYNVMMGNLEDPSEEGEEDE